MTEDADMGGRGGGSPGNVAQQERARAEAAARDHGLANVESQIEQAYQKLLGENQGIFGGKSIYLDDLRAELASRGVTNRALVDRALDDLALRHRVTLLPLEPVETFAGPNRLSPGRVRKVQHAAVRSGGQDKHKIRFE